LTAFLRIAREWERQTELYRFREVKHYHRLSGVCRLVGLTSGFCLPVETGALASPSDVNAECGS
jgi:hypothetical protein